MTDEARAELAAQDIASIEAIVRVPTRSGSARTALEIRHHTPGTMAASVIAEHAARSASAPTGGAIAEAASVEAIGPTGEVGSASCPRSRGRDGVIAIREEGT